MTLPKLENSLFAVRIVTLGVCFLALLMYIANGRVLLNNVNIWTLPSLVILALVTTTELIAPFCFGVEHALPNHLGCSLLIILVDCLVVCFAMSTGFQDIGVFIYKNYSQVCFINCKISLLYALLVWVGGTLGGIAMLCNIALAAKMNFQRQAQD